MIVLTGATGQLGAQVARQLLRQLPADQIGVSVRDTAKATELAERGVRVRRGDYSDPDSLAEAFEGAECVYIVSSDVSGDEALAQHEAAIDAAYAAGAERVIYTSHQAASGNSLFAPMRDHAATEKYLVDRGGALTSLRHGFYAATVPWLIGPALETGTIAAPIDGPVSWTTHADLAEADAIVLSGEGGVDGLTSPLTSPEALDLDDVAGILSEISGRRIARVVVGDDEWKAGLVEQGVPDAAAEFSLGIFRASRRGEFNVTSSALEELLGRSATPLQSVLESVVAAR